MTILILKFHLKKTEVISLLFFKSPLFFIILTPTNTAVHAIKIKPILKDISLIMLDKKIMVNKNMYPISFLKILFVKASTP